MPILYSINKAIHQPVRFRGLQAQYIGYLGAGLAALLLLFALLYLSGIYPGLDLAITLTLGFILIRTLYHWSNRYGPHGRMKKQARRWLPRRLTLYSRQTFLQ